jgi:hypothetical protein
MRRRLYGGHKPRSFPPNCASKMRESQQLFFKLRLVIRIFEEFEHPAIQTKIAQLFGGFFHQIKVRQPTAIQTSRRLDSFLYEATQIYEVFSNVHNKNLKIKSL